MRHFRHKILFGVIPVLATLTLVGTSIKDVKPQPINTTKLEARHEEEEEFYRFAYDDEEATVELFLNARPKAYKHVKKDDLSKILDGFVDALKAIGTLQLDLGGSVESSQPQQSRHYRVPSRAPELSSTDGVPQDVDQLYATLLKYEFLDENGNINARAVEDYAAGYNRALADLTSYYGYLDNRQNSQTYDEETYREQASEYAVNLVEALGGEEKVNDALEREDSTEYLADQIYDLFLSQNVGQSEVEPNLDNLTNITNTVQNAIRKQEEQGGAASGEADVKIVNIVATFDAENVGGESNKFTEDVEDTLNNPNNTSSQYLEFLITADPEITAALIANTIGDTGKTSTGGTTIEHVIDSMDPPDIMTAFAEVGSSGMKDITSAAPGVSRKALAEAVLSKVTVKDIVKMVDDISFNGREIMVGKSVNFGELKKFLRDLPRPHEIKDFTDDEMQETFDVVLGTKLGTIHFTLTVGLFGNCDYIRRICTYLTNTFFIHEVNGTYEITVKSPENLYKLYAKFMESEAFDKSLKSEIIDTIFSSVEEIKEYVANKQLNDIVDDLKSVDYAKVAETLLSAEEWKLIVGEINISDERIDSAIDKFFELVEKVSTKTYDDILDFVNSYFDVSKLDNDKLRDYVNRFFKFVKKVADRDYDSALFRALIAGNQDAHDKIYGDIEGLANYTGAYDKIKNLVLRVLNRIPENHMNKKLMDYYQGDSKFNYNEKITLNYGSILNKLEKKLPEQIYKIVDKLVENLPTSVKINADVTVPHVHAVNYMLHEKDAQGSADDYKAIVLPKGADILYASELINARKVIDDVKTIIPVSEINGHKVSYWVDENGDQIDKMPDRDITVYPVLNYELNVDSDVVVDGGKTYDGTGYITVSLVDGSTPYEVSSYQWYRYESGEWLVITGETSETIHLTDVAHSGDYKCVITLESGKVYETGVLTACINPAEIDMTPAWSTPTSFVYDGEEHEVHLVDIEELEGKGEVKYGIDPNDIEEAIVPLYTNVGEYVTYAKLCPDANHALKAGQAAVLSQEWSISQAEVDLSYLEWSYLDEQKPYSGAGIALPDLNYKEGTSDEIKQLINDGASLVKEVTYRENLNDQPVSLGDEKFAYEVGYYEVTYAVSAKNGNYKIVNDSHIVGVVAKLQVTSTTIPEDAFIFDQTEFTYDGEVKLPKLVRNPDCDTDYTNLFKFKYKDITGAKATGEYDPGTYQLIVELELKDSSLEGGYIYKSSYECTWKINKAVLSLAGLAVESKVVTYDGTLQNAYLRNANGSVFDDERFNIEYTYVGADDYVSHDGATNVGIYEVSAKVQLAEEQLAYYELDEESPTEFSGGSLKINPAEWDVSDFHYDIDQKEFVYDGNSHIPNLIGFPTDKVSVDTVVVSPDNGAVNAGHYEVTYTLISEDPNYVIPSGYEKYTVGYDIKKAQVAVPTLSWSYDSPFTYNGEAQSVEIKSQLPKEAEVKYSGATSAVEVGHYTAIADINLKSEYLTGNYELVGQTHSELIWEIKGIVVYHFVSTETEGDDPLGIADSTVGLPIEFELSVEKVDVDLTEADFSKWYGNKEVEVVAAYEVKFLDANGNEVNISEYDTKLTVKLYIPEQYRGDSLKLFHVGEEDELSLVTSSQTDNYIEFETTHLSTYALTKTKTPPPAPTDESSNISSLIFVGGVSTVAVSAFYIILLLGKKKASSGK